MAEQGNILCGLIVANWQRMHVRRCKCRFRTPILKRHQLKVKKYLDLITSIFETSKACTYEPDVFNAGVGSVPGEPLAPATNGTRFRNGLLRFSPEVDLPPPRFAGPVELAPPVPPESRRLPRRAPLEIHAQPLAVGRILGQ